MSSITMLYVLLALFCCTLTSVRASETGCTVDGNVVAPGQQYDFPETCGMNICKGNNEWDHMACGLIESREDWKFIPEDTSKGYPECCAHSVPPCLAGDVIDNVRSFFGLNITFGDVTVDHCKELTPRQTQDKPVVSFNADPGSFYLLAMVDPDAPSTLKKRQFVHWMVGNIQGNKVDDGCELFEYSGPTPPPNTGLHRYIFVLFKQLKKIAFTEPKIPAHSMENRGSFSLEKFVDKHDLVPMVMNLFLCQQPDRN